MKNFKHFLSLLFTLIVYTMPVLASKKVDISTIFYLSATEILRNLVQDNNVEGVKKYVATPLGKSIINEKYGPNLDTALHLACKKNNIGEKEIEIIRTLVEDGGANIKAKDKYDKTPIVYVKNLDSKHRITNTIFYKNDHKKIEAFPSINDNNTCSNILNSYESVYNASSLMELVENNKLNAVKKFLNTPGGKEQVNKVTWINRKAGNYHPITIACENKNYEMVKTLIENGASVNVEDGIDHETLLNNTCCQNDVKIAALLIQHGAKTEINLRRSYKALHYSSIGIACKNKNLKLLKVLVEGGADVNALDQWGCPPIYYAWKSGDIEITKYLISKNARPRTIPPIHRTSPNNIWENANEKTIRCLFEFFRKPKNYKNIEAEEWAYILSNSVPLKKSSEEQIVFMQKVVLNALDENLKSGTFTHRLTFKENPLRNEKNVEDHLLLIEIIEDMINLLLGPTEGKNSLPKYDAKKKNLIEKTCLVDPVLLILKYDHKMNLKQYNRIFEYSRRFDNFKKFASAAAAIFSKTTNQNKVQETIDNRDNKKFMQFFDLKVSFDNNKTCKPKALLSSYTYNKLPYLSEEIFTVPEVTEDSTQKNPPVSENTEG